MRHAREPLQYRGCNFARDWIDVISTCLLNKARMFTLLDLQTLTEACKIAYIRLVMQGSELFRVISGSIYLNFVLAALFVNPV